MKKQDIYNIYLAGVEHGLEFGPFPGLSEPYPKESLFQIHKRLTDSSNKDAKSVLWTVIIAGFNYGTNLRKEKPTEEELQSTFENLIAGKPLTAGDNSYYTIKDEIDKLLAL